MAAQIQNESTLPEQTQFDSSGTVPVADHGNVFRLAEQHGLISAVENAVPVYIQKPGPVAKDADPFNAGAIPVAGYRNIACKAEGARAQINSRAVISCVVPVIKIEDGRGNDIEREAWDDFSYG